MMTATRLTVTDQAVLLWNMVRSKAKAKSCGSHRTDCHCPASRQCQGTFGTSIIPKGLLLASRINQSPPSFTASDGVIRVFFAAVW